MIRPDFCELNFSGAKFSSRIIQNKHDPFLAFFRTIPDNTVFVHLTDFFCLEPFGIFGFQMFLIRDPFDGLILIKDIGVSRGSG